MNIYIKGLFESPQSSMYIPWCSLHKETHTHTYIWAVKI